MRTSRRTAELMHFTPTVAVALIVVAGVWGSAFPMIKIGLVDFSAPHFTLLRHLVASIAYLPLLLVSRARLVPRRRDLPHFALLGILGFFVYHLALNFGSTRVSAGAASLIIATAPAITAIVAAFLIRDRLPPLGWFGSALSFAGISFIVLGDADAAGTAGATAPAAALTGGFTVYAWFIVIAAVATAFFAVLQRPLFARYRPIEVAAFATWSGTVPMLVFVPGIVEAVAAASGGSLGAAIYSGVFPSAIAYTLFAFALSRASATIVTAWLYIVPLFALLAAWLLLGEVPSALTAVGGAVAIAGVVVLNLAKQRASRIAASRADMVHAAETAAAPANP
ncbi:MAG TPA: DMT family transporter [Trueperaceae bacterium]|nr:DMT family transporter [Trueperaceae bacterium]